MPLETRVRRALQEVPLPGAGMSPDHIVALGKRRRLRRRALQVAFACTVAAGVGVPIAQQTAGSPSQTAVAPALGNSTVADTEAKYHAALVTWAECLGDNGVRISVPSGHPYDQFLAELGAHKGDPTFDKASTACSSLLPSVPPELERAWGQIAGGGLSAAAATRLRDYRDCVGQHGVTLPPLVVDDTVPVQMRTWELKLQGSEARDALAACGTRPIF